MFVIRFVVFKLEMDDGGSANERSLLDDYDDLLLQAIEESKKLYEEVELPRQSSDLVYQGDEAKGFDLSAGRTWMYPTNYPVRNYQCQMVKSALFQNTLVCLPTGLGKTFIAAVVMYNFYRWYPQGKIIFMAPTKPLVHQQIDACYKVAGVPRSDTAEMTGNLPSRQRAEAWRDKRLFFLTPHVVSNDISSGICPVDLIRCVVIDEAHRATGNYSYCQVVNKLVESNCLFRVLALSATPGSDIQGVQQVVDNLRISHLELRSEESLDVVQYVHRRKVDTVMVSLTGYIKEVQERYFSVIEFYMRNLLKYKVLYGSIRSLSKFRIFKFRDEFRSKPPPNLARNNFPFVEADFAVCISLYHALELLTLHGLRSFVKYLNGVIYDDKGQPNVKMRLSQCGSLSSLLEEVREKLGSMDVENPNPDVSIVAADGSFNLQETVFSHPKLEKLREVIVRHFESQQTDGTSTRVMVFCQYRETVVEICHILKQYKPLIKPMSFIGQSSSGKHSPGFTQKQQIMVVKKFCSGGYNTLISTCVGEEGLDIGDVDLIVCFDCHNSPIRLVQRMGRTGRKRDGRIVMLMTEGSEYQKYRKSVSQHKSISKDILQKRVKMLTDSPRMVPKGVVPSYHEIFVTVPEEKAESKTKKGKSMDLKTLWGKKCNGKSSKDTSDKLPDEPVPRFDRIPRRRFLFGLEGEELQRNFTHLTQDGNRSVHKGTFSCPTWIEPWKLKTFSVEHSSLSQDLIHLATLISSKKENLPQTQTVSRAKKMEFSELRTRNNKRKRSGDSKVPNEKRPRKGNATGTKRQLESQCESGVFKVPKISKKEESNKEKLKSSFKDLRSYYQVSSNTTATTPEPAATSKEAPDVVVIENDKPLEAETEVVAHLEPKNCDSEIEEVCLGAEEQQPDEFPQVVKLRAIFEEVKAMLKLDRCRDSKCGMCCPQKRDVSQASYAPVSIPSEFPDVDELVTSLTVDSIGEQKKELFQESVTLPQVALNFSLFDDIDIFLSLLEFGSSMNEKSPSRSCEVESDLSSYLDKCNKPENAPAKSSNPVSKSMVEGPTVFPKLNFDTTNAIDQLFEDLDEDGCISPKLCSGGITKCDVIKRLSQTADKTLSPKRASCPTDSFVSPIFAPKFSRASNFPACSTPKQVKPERRASRLSRFPNLPTVVPLGEPSTFGKSGARPAVPNFNFTLFLDECSLLFDNEPEPNNPPETFPGTSTTNEEERNLIHSVEMFTPVKGKWVEESPGGKAVVNHSNKSHTINSLEESAVMPGQVIDGSPLDDSFRPRKRRRALKCLSPAPCGEDATTPSPKRSSVPGDTEVTVNLLSSDDEYFIPNVKKCVPAAPNGATTSSTWRVRDVPKERRNDFIDYEAEVSHDASRGDDERVSSSDEEDRRFVNDFPTQASQDMHAEYLKSVRSPPVKSRGRFKIPTPRARRREDVLSDPEESYEDSYERDSFCVDDEECTMHELDTPAEITIAEDASYGGTPKGESGRRVVKGWKRIRIATNSESD